MSFRHYSAPVGKFSSVNLQRPQVSVGVSNAALKLIGVPQGIIPYSRVGPEV